MKHYRQLLTNCPPNRHPLPTHSPPSPHQLPTSSPPAPPARLKHYLWDSDALATYFETRNGMLGADYSSKFAPWLAHGCLSPRQVAHECRRYRVRVVVSDSSRRTNALDAELLPQGTRAHACRTSPRTGWSSSSSGATSSSCTAPSTARCASTAPPHCTSTPLHLHPTPRERLTPPPPPPLLHPS